eukprot:CAMPEP_0117500412 /NCGR_PEP_ID=MMETSP0784-20121206/22763_1 /TAXON_ID=39447 /ORGANISM="" /LENGTH=525 /DNA_ID=CAMNT_0005295621 /DNA_START=69 /DNA_END=1643 /DNA_ORIENTATION=+
MGGLKSYTAYCIQVTDFGRNYIVERRFDDFQKLHQDLAPVDVSLPALPEKKMFASTDASVVAERRPAFERLLNHMLQNEEIAFEKEQFLWKFLDLPLPGVVAARYLYKNRRVSYVKQAAKLLEAKYEKEHAYRLCHECILRANLQLIAGEGLLISRTPTVNIDISSGGEGELNAPTPENMDSSVDGKSPSASGTQVNESEMEGNVLEMLRYAVGQGGDAVRKRFLEEGGLKTTLELLQRMARREGAGPAPDQRVRNVLNAFIQAEGEHYPAVFAEFLRRGGVTILSGFRELCSTRAQFAEFIGKLLWLGWEAGTQDAFLQADNSGAEALAILSALYTSGSKSGQIMAGLLLSSLIANDAFKSDREREDKAVAGVCGLVEDLVVTLPVSGEQTTQATNGGAEEVQAAETFLSSLGRNERSFSRLLAITVAPMDSNSGTMAYEGAAVWSSCSFALWCIVKVQPKPARLASVRKILPSLASAGTPRVRWLTGQLLLHLNVAASGAAPTGTAPAQGEGSGDQLGAQLGA